MTALIAEQNSAFALELANRLHLLENGEIELSGETVAFKDDEYVQEAYIGKRGFAFWGREASCPLSNLLFLIGFGLNHLLDSDATVMPQILPVFGDIQDTILSRGRDEA